MENTPNKRKWRLNLFDVIFIACVLIVGMLVISIFGRGDSGGGIFTPSQQETVVYTVLFERMTGDSATLIRPGDELVDKVENRMMGTVIGVEVVPSTMLQINFHTGERMLSPLPTEYAQAALVTIRANASITSSQITLDSGFVVRAGVRVSANGPLYNGHGFIVDIERGEAE